MWIWVSTIRMIALLCTVAWVSGCVHYDPFRVFSITDPTEIRTLLAGTTSKSWSFFHQTQVEFLKDDGTSYLWYPGNRGVARGRWRIEPNVSSYSICFRYGANSYNPVTGRSGGDWECSSAVEYLLGTYEIVRGDPFDLGSGKVPFVLPKKRFRLEDLMEMGGRDPARLHAVLDTGL